MELGRSAVEARLAACVQVAGPVMSTFWWEGDLERAEEWLLLFKLPAAGYQDLADFLTQRHSYDEPEIIAMPIVAGSAGLPQLDGGGDPAALTGTFQVRITG